jgi:hypothetical protein
MTSAVRWPTAEVPSSLWSTLSGPHIVSLPMILHRCHRFYLACAELTDAADWLTSPEVNPPNRLLTSDDLPFIRQPAELLNEAITVLGIKGGFEADCHEVITHVRSLGGGPWEGSFEVRADLLARDYRRVRDGLLQELHRYTFLQIPTEDAKYYLNPEKEFPETLVSFPSATRDVEEACKCYALGRYTACVFHAMAILQVGLHTLAGDVGISLKFSIELAEWGDILRAIKERIKPYASLPRGDALREKYDQLYAGCADQFVFFKDAWRNHVAHNREVYDREKAHSALEHVRVFMESLSTRLHE